MTLTINSASNPNQIFTKNTTHTNTPTGYKQNFGALHSYATKNKELKRIITKENKVVKKLRKNLHKQLKTLFNMVDSFNLTNKLSSNHKEAANLRDMFGIQKPTSLNPYSTKLSLIKGILKNSKYTEQEASKILFDSFIIENERKFAKNLAIYHLTRDLFKAKLKNIKNATSIIQQKTYTQIDVLKIKFLSYIQNILYKDVLKDIKKYSK